MTDTEIIMNAPPSAIYVACYDHGEACGYCYINSEREFFDDDERRWVDMDLVDNYFHSFRSLRDIQLITSMREIIDVSKKLGFYAPMFDSSPDHLNLCRLAAKL